MVKVERNNRVDCLEIDSLNYNVEEELSSLKYHSKFTEIMKIPPQFHRINLKTTVRTLKFPNVICRTFAQRTSYFYLYTTLNSK